MYRIILSFTSLAMVGHHYKTLSALSIDLTPACPLCASVNACDIVAWPRNTMQSSPYSSQRNSVPFLHCQRSHCPRLASHARTMSSYHSSVPTAVSAMQERLTTTQLGPRLNRQPAQAIRVCVYSPGSRHYGEIVLHQVANPSCNPTGRIYILE